MPDKRLGKLYLHRMADETKVKRKGLPKRKSQNDIYGQQPDSKRKMGKENRSPSGCRSLLYNAGAIVSEQATAPAWSTPCSLGMEMG